MNFNPKYYQIIESDLKIYIYNVDDPWFPKNIILSYNTSFIF